MTVLNTILIIAGLGGIYALMSQALNLQLGYAGIINFGVVAYFAVGAYAYAIVTQPPPGPVDTYLWGLSWPAGAGFIVAGLAAVGFALITGWPTLRLRHEYLALVAFAFAEVLHSVILNTERLTNGALGLSGIEQPLLSSFTSLGYNLFFAALVLAAVACCFLISSRLTRAPFGQTLKAIRDDELLVEMAGKSARRYRLQVFLLAAVMCGTAGAFYAWFTTYIAPGLFTVSVTMDVWIALVIGGVGSRIGAVVGPFVFIGFQEATRYLGTTVAAADVISATRTGLVGLLLILLLSLQPGLGSERETLWNQLWVRARSARRRKEAIAAR